MSATEIDRLSCMANALRPDWPVNSLRTFISQHRGRAYRDVAVALAWIATDAHTNTPARLNEAGPWWRATTAGDGSTPLSSYRVMCDDHPTEVMPCQTCKAETERMSDEEFAQVQRMWRAELANAPKYVPPAVVRARAQEAQQ